MASGRIVPVRDRVLTAVQRRLLTINGPPGYQNSLTAVYRRPGDVWRATNPPEAYLYFGRSRIINRTGSASETSGTQDRIYESLAMQVRAFSQAPEEQCDREGNILLADIQKCLCTVHEPIRDPFYPNAAIFTFPQSTTIGYPPTGSGYVIALAIYQLTYYYVATNPNRWDEDDADVYEEQLQQEAFP